LHGLLGRKLADDGAVRCRLGVIQAAAPTVFRQNTNATLTPRQKTSRDPSQRRTPLLRKLRRELPSRFASAVINGI